MLTGKTLQVKEASPAWQDKNKKTKVQKPDCTPLLTLPEIERLVLEWKDQSTPIS